MASKDDHFLLHLLRVKSLLGVDALSTEMFITFTCENKKVYKINVFIILLQIMSKLNILAWI